MTTESYLSYPSEQKFYRMIAFAMGLIGFNSHYWSWYENPNSRLFAVQRKIVIIFLPVIVVSMIFFLSLHYQDYEFNVIATILSVIPFTLCLTCKLASAQTESYKIANSDFMDKIHLYNFFIQQYPRKKHNFVKNILLKTEKNTRTMFYSMGLVALICCSAWVFCPVIHNIQNNHSIHNITTRLELGFYLWQPFDFEFNFYGYLVSQILVIYCSFIGSIMYLVFDTMNVSYVLHLTGHIHILKYDLKMGQNKILSDDEWEKKLREITVTYSFITQSFKKAEKAYGFNIASVYAQNLVQGGLLLYQFVTSGSSMDVILTYGLMLPIFMGMLIILSAVLENVRIQADDMANLVYALPWERMNVRNRKMVQFIISQIQPTLQYKAAFNIKAGVRPAIYILKTTFSYYVMIKSRKEM